MSHVEADSVACSLDELGEHPAHRRTAALEFRTHTLGRTISHGLRGAIAAELRGGGAAPWALRAAVPYRVAWLVFIYLGAVGSLHLVWDVADTLNALMAIPNLVSVLISIPLLLRLQREFFSR